MNDRDPFYRLYSPPRPLEKTPYQLDLEVKDRKPDIVPKVGDKVKIKSQEWYETWKDSNGDIWIGRAFTKSMKEYCGLTLTIEDFFDGGFFLKGSSMWWSPEMFEEVYPKESSTGHGNPRLSYSIVPSIEGLGKGLSLATAINAINSVQEIDVPYGIGTLLPQQYRGITSELLKDTEKTINSTQNCFCGTSAYVHQDFFEKKDPELQTIKKHRFIKLEKL